MIVLRFEAVARNFDEFNHDSFDRSHVETGDRRLNYTQTLESNYSVDGWRVADESSLK